MNTIANAVLFADGLQSGDDEALNSSLIAWVERLVDVGVLDLRIVATAESPALIAAVESLNRRGTLWVSIGPMEPDWGNDTDLVIVGSLAYVPEFSLVEAMTQHKANKTVMAIVRSANALEANCFSGDQRFQWVGSFVTGSPIVLLFEPGQFQIFASCDAETVPKLPETVMIAPDWVLKECAEDKPQPRPTLAVFGKRPAVFLDRDGTIIEDADYLRDPAKIRFFPQSAPAIQRLRQHGYACVLISNQSGVGRGIFSEADMHAVHRAFLIELTRMGGALDGAYYCPFAPTVKSSTALDHPDRKPGPGMLLRAAEDLGLDLSVSWMIGDSARDLVAGRNAGCRDCLFVESGKAQSSEDLELCRTYTGVANLQMAADRILAKSSR